jgi:hypothetical protein
MRDGDLDLDIAVAPKRARHLRDLSLHHLARHWIDGWLSRRHWQSRQGHGADARPSLELNAASRSARRRCEHQCAMGHVWIVAGIMTRPRSPSVALAIDGKREGDALAAGKRDLNGIWEVAGQKRGEGSLGRCRSTSAGGPAAAERACLVQFAHWKGNRALPLACHREGAA